MSAKEEPLGADNPAFQPDDPCRTSEEKPAPGDAAKVDVEADGGGSKEERAQWGSGMEFLMSCIAMSVGLGNVWRFPFTAYENGGGAFLIPYIIVLIVIGRPLYYLEMTLGQFTSRGCVKIWSMAPALRGVGYGQIIATACVLSYYCSLMALTCFYLVASFNEHLPWAECRPEWGPCIPGGGGKGSESYPDDARTSAELFFLKHVLDEPASLEGGLGAPDWRLVLCLGASWLMVLGVVARGVRSSGKAAYFLALFPYVIMVVLLVRGVTLEGADTGMLFFIEPDWERLADAKVWYAAVTQAFFSLNVGFGSLINYASYNNFRHNIYRDAMIVTTLDTFTSLLAGCTIFAILGNLAHELDQDVRDVVKSGAGLAFISYPDAIAKFDDVPQLFAVLFFLMLLVLGLGSAVALLSAVTTIICDNFPSFRQLYVSIAGCAIGFLVGLVYVTPGGQWMLTLVDHFGATYPVLALMCVEMVGIAWIYGVDNMCTDVKFMQQRRAGVYWRLTWGLITPVFLLVVLAYAAAMDEPLLYGGRLFPDHYYAVGWVLLAVVVSMCPCFIAVEVGTRWLRKGMTFGEALSSAFRASAEWGPGERLLRAEWAEAKAERRRREAVASESWSTRATRKLLGCPRLPALSEKAQ